MPGEHIPYRGEPVPEYPKPKKRIRNLRQEKMIRFFVLGVCAFVMIALSGIMLFAFRTNSGDYTLAFIIGCVILLFLFITLSVADGLKSINKFRKGYDIDISGETKAEHNGRTEFPNE